MVVAWAAAAVVPERSEDRAPVAERRRENIQLQTEKAEEVEEAPDADPVPFARVYIVLASGRGDAAGHHRQAEPGVSDQAYTALAIAMVDAGEHHCREQVGPVEVVRVCMVLATGKVGAEGQHRPGERAAGRVVQGCTPPATAVVDVEDPRPAEEEEADLEALVRVHTAPAIATAGVEGRQR